MPSQEILPSPTPSPDERCRIISEQDAKGCFIEHDDDVLVDMLHDESCRRARASTAATMAATTTAPPMAACDGSDDDDSDDDDVRSMDTQTDGHAGLAEAFGEMFVLSRSECGTSHWAECSEDFASRRAAMFAQMYADARGTNSGSDVSDGSGSGNCDDDNDDDGYDCDRRQWHWTVDCSRPMIPPSAPTPSADDDHDISSAQSERAVVTQQPASVVVAMADDDDCDAGGKLSGGYDSKSSQQERHIAALNKLLEQQLFQLTAAERNAAAEGKRQRLALAKSKQEALKERVAMQLAQKRAADAHAAECAARDRDARLLLVRILKAKASLSNAF